MSRTETADRTSLTVSMVARSTPQGSERLISACAADSRTIWRPMLLKWLGREGIELDILDIAECELS